MAWRFRKSIKLGKFVKLNIGKKGLGLSTGVKGARVGLNSRGTYTSVAIPGTGISHMTYHGKNKKQNSSVILLERKPMNIKCTNCNFQGEPKYASGWAKFGTVALCLLGLFTFPFGILLWLIVPFLNKISCPQCGWKNLIKIKKEETSPNGDEKVSEDQVRVNNSKNHQNPIALSDNAADQIQKLYDLKEKGILSEVEFETKKQKILES